MRLLVYHTASGCISSCRSQWAASRQGKRRVLRCCVSFTTPEDSVYHYFITWEPVTWWRKGMVIEPSLIDVHLLYLWDNLYANIKPGHPEISGAESSSLPHYQYLSEIKLIISYRNFLRKLWASSPCRGCSRSVFVLVTIRELWPGLLSPTLGCLMSAHYSGQAVAVHIFLPGSVVWSESSLLWTEQISHSFRIMHRVWKTLSKGSTHMCRAFRTGSREPFLVSPSHRAGRISYQWQEFQKMTFVLRLISTVACHLLIL